MTIDRFLAAMFFVAFVFALIHNHPMTCEPQLKADKLNIINEYNKLLKETQE